MGLLLDHLLDLMLVLLFLERSMVGMLDVVESHVRFLIVENSSLICTVIVDGTNCAN